MAGALIGALRVSLGLDSAKFESGAKRAQKSLTGLERSMSSLRSGISGFAAALTVGFFAKQIGDALEYAGSLGEVAQQLGVTAKQLQVYRFAAGQVGVSQDQLEAGLKKLNVSLGQAKLGAEGPKKAFAALSKLLGQDIVATSKQAGDALPKVADALAKVSDRTERAALETAIMSRNGSMLDNMLSGGSAALNELAQAAERLGIVLSDDEIKHADETADKLRAVKTVLQAQIASTVAKNADSILSLASALGTLSGEILRFLNSNPQLALGILGAMLGGRVGGLPGAVLGGVGGAVLGGRVARNLADSSMDIGFRRQKLLEARNARDRALRAPDVGGRVIPGIGTPASSGGKVNIKAANEELKRQASLLMQAVALHNAASSPTPQGLKVDPFLASKGGKDKKPKEDHTAEQQLRDEEQFSQDVRRAQIDVLQARRDLAHSAEEQAAIDLQILDKQKEGYEAELQFEVALNKLTKGKEGLTEEQAKQLRIEYDKTDALRRQAIAEDLRAQKKHDATELADNQYSIEREIAEKEASLAETAEDRRKAELKVLDIIYRQERARLEAVLADEKSSELAKKEAKARLDALDKMKSLDEKGVNQSNRGPLAQYLSELPTTAEKWNEALQNVAVDGLKSIEDGLLDILDGTKSVAEAFTDMARSIIRDLLKIAIRRFITAPLARALFGGFSEGGFVGDGFATGGFVSGPGSATSDSIPAFLSNGEFVINAKATRRFLPLLETLNGGDVAAFARGGISIPRHSSPHMAFAGGASFGGGVNINFHVSGNVSRETMNQIAARTKGAIATASRAGLG